ncbi:MAG: hypothetical protein IH602_17575 [Bryobacteraceae bacterium]|nr:hypothetical protein [Bryobacteraceae bacterium]
MTMDVLYFPFIRVPESPWLTRMLLYWDHVGTITPYEFMQEPERLGPHTQSLVQEGLVLPIFPGQYVHDLPQFEEQFLRFVSSKSDVLDRRRAQFLAGSHAPIHLEKLGTVGNGLEELHLARREGNWSLVETDTAEEFMAYLATVLGQLPEVQSVPITDQLSGIGRLAASSVDSGIEARLASLRTEVLRDVFPAPVRPLTAVEIALFKKKHHDLLSRFRLEVEKEVVRLADFQDESLRRVARDNLSDRIEQDVLEIGAKLQEAGFGGISSSKWLAVLGNVPVVGTVFSLLGSVESLFESGHTSPAGPFAYAGYARAMLLD